MEQPSPGDRSNRAIKTWIYPGAAQGATTDMLLLWLSYSGTCFYDKGRVPQAEGQQGARLLVKFQMDALQLPCSHQLMRNNGRRTLTLQTVLPTPENQRRKCQGKWDVPEVATSSVPLHTSDKCKTIVKAARKSDFLYHRCHRRRGRAELVCGRNLLRPLLNLPLAADGGERCFGVEL